MKAIAMIVTACSLYAGNEGSGGIIAAFWIIIVNLCMVSRLVG